MGKKAKIDPDAQYRVQALEKFELGRVKMRPGQRGTLKGSVVEQVSDKVELIEG
jgi:Tfp pilus assembly protein PilP